MRKTLLGSAVCILMTVSFLSVCAQELTDLSKDAFCQVGSRVWSNVEDDNNLLLKDGKRSGRSGENFAFHTDKDNPFIIITLSKPALIKKIYIENRKDGSKERAATLTVWTSDDNKAWTMVWQAAKAENEWNIDFKDKGINAAYLKLGLLEENYFHLNKVRIFGYYDN